MMLTKRHIFEVTDLSGRETIMRVTGGMKARARFQNPSYSPAIKRDNMENPPLLCLSDLHVYDSGSVFSCTK